MFCVSMCSIIEMGGNVCGGHVICGIWCTYVCCVLGNIYSVRNVAFAICAVLGDLCVMHYVHTCVWCGECIVYICVLCWGLLRIMCWDVCVLCGCVVIGRSCAGCKVGVGRGCWVQD